MIQRKSSKDSEMSSVAHHKLKMTVPGCPVALDVLESGQKGPIAIDSAGNLGKSGMFSTSELIETRSLISVDLQMLYDTHNFCCGQE